MRQFTLLGIFLLLSISGCATIVDGKRQSVTIQSSPAEADVFINGTLKGKTPLTLELERSKTTALKVSKEGFEDVTLTLPTSFNSMFWGNIVIGGFFGSTTDGATGAVTEYVPNTHLINLTPN